jgi:aryl-alcohol dehydrogenase-like predicted oxidoreductase
MEVSGLVNRLVLGTVRFGLPSYGYGAHRTTPTESLAIVQRAWELGIRRADTALAYGDAWLYLVESDLPWTVTTKLKTVFHGIPANAQDRVHVLWHNPTADELATLPMLAGASVYTVAEADAAVEYGACLIQVPYCAVNQAHGPHMQRWRDEGVTVYARAPWVQGLLCLPWPDAFRRVSDTDTGMMWRTPIGVFADTCQRFGADPIAAALWFALDSPADYIVFGCDAVAQLEQDVALACEPRPSWWPECAEAIRRECAEFNLSPPSLWR